MKNIILNRVIELTGVNVFKKTNQKEYTQARSLLFSSLKEVCKMTDKHICDFSKQKGLTINRSSITLCRNKFNLYCKSNIELKDYYNSIVFEDYKVSKTELLKRLSESKRTLKKVRRRNDYLESKILECTNETVFTNETLIELVKNVPEEKTKLVYDRLNLFIKSWGWKDKALPNACKTYECGSIRAF